MPNTSWVVARLLADLAIVDLAMEDPPIAEVIDHVFAAGEVRVAD